ncbi:hypothetical protein Tco_0958141 [Tanacetum coccineum]
MEIWDRVKLLIEGSELSLQERESKLYDEFDIFTSEKGEMFHSYYLRFVQLINDMNTIGMSMKPIQNVQGRQIQGYVGSGGWSNATSTWVNRNVGTNTACQTKVIRCYNYQGEGHIARQCTKPKRPKNLDLFKEKMLLAKALESGVVLDEEQMAFLADNEDTVTTGQASQELSTIIIFQIDDLNAFDSDYEEAPLASAILMAKLSAYDSDMHYYEQPPFINDSDIDITSDSNVISYNQYLQETENKVVQDTTSSAQQDAMIMSVIEEMSNQVAKFRKHDALSMLDTKETLKLAEESKLKMLAKQNDLIAKEKKVNMAPIDYDALNKLSEHFVKHFVLKKQLSAEQAFWLPISKLVSEKPRFNPNQLRRKFLSYFL